MGRVSSYESALVDQSCGSNQQVGIATRMTSLSSQHPQIGSAVEDRVC